tara:strand:+ start:3474 stop:3905 length:432 start_codon:yes stop_codon:yes gene_type:complete
MIAAVVLSGVLALSPGYTHPADMPDAQDMRGFEPSLYQGKWYDKKWERNRKCIMKRESRFDYRAANKSSSARGAYQFLDSKWRVSLTHMLMPEHKDRKKEVKALRKKPIHKWSRYWQDAAFYVAWQNGKGAKHWYYPGSNCIG